MYKRVFPVLVFSSIKLLNFHVLRDIELYWEQKYFFFLIQVFFSYFYFFLLLFFSFLMKTLFVSLFLFAAFFLVTTAVSAHEEEWFPPNWQDRLFHEKKMLRHKNAIEQVRKERKIEKYITRADVLKTDEKECVVCFGIADDLIAVVMSNTGSAVIEDVVNDYCAKHFDNNTKDAALCKDLGDLLVDLAHKGLDELVGSLHFNVSNILCADLLKLCVEPCCDVNRPYAPEQIRIGFQNQYAVAPFVNITVQWMTLNPTVGDVVQYFVSNGAMQQTSLNAEQHSYSFGGNVGWTHSVVIPNLPQNSTITYSVGSPKGMSTTPFSFRTLPIDVGTPTGRPLKFFMTADMGIYNSSNTLARMIEKVDQVDFWIHPGDLSYSDGEQRVWNVWGREIEPIVSKIPWVVSCGNHEIFANFSPYKNRYGYQNPMPSNGQGRDGMYYHVELGASLSVMMMNSETPINTADMDHFGQLEWAKNLLPSLAQKSGSFLISAFHRPLYCSNGGSDCELFGPLLRSQVEDMFNQNGVDLLFNGHMHDTEYTYPVKNGGKYVNNSFVFPEAAVSHFSRGNGEMDDLST